MKFKEFKDYLEEAMAAYIKDNPLVPLDMDNLEILIDTDARKFNNHMTAFDYVTICENPSGLPYIDLSLRTFESGCDTCEHLENAKKIIKNLVNTHHKELEIKRERIMDLQDIIDKYAAESVSIE